MALRVAGWLAAALLASGCAAIQPARVALPDGLAARTELVEAHGLGSGTRGGADVDGLRIDFQRSASRLALFGEFNVQERAALRMTTRTADGSVGNVDCNVRRRTMSVGVVEWVAKPLALQCDIAPLQAKLVLQEQRSGLGTLKVARQGELAVDGRVLTVRSLHQAEGGLVELPQPLGYVLEADGRAVAAGEVNGSTPRLFLPVGDAALRRASVPVLMALALTWDVAGG